jgi:transcriptional regulator with XRE-family HTH domain
VGQLPEGGREVTTVTRIGAQIKAARERRGWSQNRLATLLNEAANHATLDGQYVSRWERGVRTPDAFWLSHLADVLQLDLAQLEAAHAWATATPSAAGLSTPSKPQLSSDRRVVFLPPGQAEATDSVPQADVDALLTDCADESATLLAWADVSNVGDLTVEQVHAELLRISHSYLKTPTLPLFHRTRALRSRVVELLTNGRQKPSQSRDLYSAAGWASTLLAWISTDLNAPRSAEAHLRVAWVFADNADQNNLRAWIRACQHTAAFWQDDYERADEYAKDGLRYAGTGTAGLFLSSALALDLARHGDREGSRDYFRLAHELSEKESPTRDALGGPFTCPRSRAGGFWSETHLALREYRAALDHVDAAVSDFENTPTHHRNLGSERMVRCQQVKAYLAAGEIDGAGSALQPILATEPEHRMRPLLKRMVEISRLVREQEERSPAAAREMCDAIYSFQRQTREMLPSGQGGKGGNEQ